MTGPASGRRLTHGARHARQLAQQRGLRRRLALLNRRFAFQRQCLQVQRTQGRGSAAQ